MPDKARVAVFVSGRGTNMAALLYASRLPDCPYEICLVASSDPDAGALMLAEAEGVATHAVSHKGMTRGDHDGAMEKAARDAGAQYIVLAGYMRILTADFVQRWEGRMLNIHPSLLPKYPGLDTHARAIAAGDSYGGASVHLVTEELDAGEVLGQIRVKICADQTSDSLAERVRHAEHQLYPQVLADYVSRGSDPQWLLDRVRELALALPETHERESHGSPGFRVGTEKSGKFFAYFSDQHHGTPHISLLVKCSSMDELDGLVEAQPQAYHKPAYYGASGWIGVILNRPGVDWESVADWLQRSWRLVAPKSVTRLLDAADEF
ncbi:phosphoribosylglycinamide formyltransferase [Qipengyuania qiaonensis]|uniref:Phosphoribosylglycinamide formyltransferase n=1 Tax=Qipengyuania qiaonensis TaxID=2867240 RepID=A0ABS7J584_9SPHN|nr:phosphoribosylglycinamide formyltransferase [Qipengyuania qiaonensis]MBX7482499.1 phosphoribosylglycinamide formyltransferase [Qipengyuania qiaonensis]